MDRLSVGVSKLIGKIPMEMVLKLNFNVLNGSGSWQPCPEPSCKIYDTGMWHLGEDGNVYHIDGRGWSVWL